MDKAATILKNKQTDVKERIDAGWAKECIEPIVEDELMTELHILSQNEPVSDAQYCYACNQICPTWDVAPTPDAMVGIIAGTCCYDHSKFNQQRKQRADVVSDALLPWFAFACVMAARQPNFIIEECVPESMVLVKGLSMFLGPHWDVQTMYLCPSMLGDPQTGLRRYTIYRNMASRVWNRAIPNPVGMFGARVAMDLTIYFAADDAYLTQKLEAYCVAKGFHSADTTFMWKDTLPFAHYKRLMNFIERDVPKLESQPIAFNCDQGSLYGCVMGPLSKRLLRRTVSYHFGLNRPQLPYEAMLQMGMPAYDEPWFSFLKDARDDVVRAVAGNAMHPRMFAAVFISTLASS